MKRARALIPLSHEHHHSLVAAKRINDLRKEADEEIKQYWLAKRDILMKEFSEHFSKEEKYLLPLLTGEGEYLSTKLVNEHRQLLRLLNSDDSASAYYYADLLKAHIRFEERELFPWLECKYGNAVLEQQLSELF